MICQSCGKKTATTHIKTIVNGKLTEYHLCGDCAKEKGYGSFFDSWSLGFGNMLGGLLGKGHPEENVLTCKKCGSTFAEIAKTGNLGCAECYTTFRRQLLPLIQRIHGTARHKGKSPGSSALCIQDNSHQMVAVQKPALEEKKRLLQKAIEAQEFEQAAVLRDEIKEMENNG